MPALVEGLGAVFDALELVVEPLLAVGETGFAALEVTAQLADLVLDRADLFLDFAAALGGLFGFLAGSLEDPGGLGLGASPDVLGFGGDAVELAAVRGLGRAGLLAYPESGARRPRARIPPRATRSP